MATAFTTVGDFLDAQNDESRAAVKALRPIVLDTHSSVSKHIKGNFPNYVVDGVDRAAVNIDRAGVAGSYCTRT